MRIIDHCNDLKKRNSDFVSISGKLQEDVENLRKSEKNLTDQLCAMCARNEKNDRISNLYGQLKESYSNLEKRYSELMETKELLQEEHALQLTKLKDRYEQQYRLTEGDFKQRLGSIKAQAECERKLFLERESQLYNELQLAQASTALQVDESEGKVESLKLQLRDTLNSHSTLRQDYLTLKTHSKYELENAKKFISDLEHKLRITEQQLRINQEQLLTLNTKSSEPVHTVNQNYPPTTTTNKYSALNINTSSAGFKNHLPDKFEASDTYVNNIRGVTKAVDHIAKETKKSYLPALKPCSKPGQKPQVPKKRKLYTPGTVDLDDFTEMP
ncbi:myosin-8-like [Photinus pyralis]|nr:myosin-8-like [Photinus pyralis]